MSLVALSPIQYASFSPASVLAHGASNRLYQHPDGSLEVVPKTPAEVFGERVLRPLIDITYSGAVRVFQILKAGCLGVDAVFSRAVNVLPVANAETAVVEKSNLERCVEGNLLEVYRITEAGITKNDPQMLEAAHKLYGPFFQQCFSDDTYSKMRAEHDRNIEYHNRQTKLLEDKLDKCEEQNPGKSCYKHTEVSKRPTLERSKSEEAEKAAPAQHEWKANPGYLCWSVYVDGWIDRFFASGGYNCDVKTNKPTV